MTTQDSDIHTRYERARNAASRARTGLGEANQRLAAAQTRLDRAETRLAAARSYNNSLAPSGFRRTTAPAR